MLTTLLTWQEGIFWGLAAVSVLLILAWRHAPGWLSALRRRSEPKCQQCNRLLVTPFEVRQLRCYPCHNPRWTKPQPTPPPPSARRSGAGAGKNGG